MLRPQLDSATRSIDLWMVVVAAARTVHALLISASRSIDVRMVVVAEARDVHAVVARKVVAAAVMAVAPQLVGLMYSEMRSEYDWQPGYKPRLRSIALAYTCHMHHT